MHLAYAFVNPFVMPAEYYKVFLERVGVGHSLGPLFPVGRHVDYLVVSPLRFELRYALVYRLYHHHHARAPSELVIVHLAVFVFGIIVQVMHMDFQIPFVTCTFHYRLPERAFQQGRHGRYYIYPHDAVFVAAILSRT